MRWLLYGCCSTPILSTQSLSLVVVSQLAHALVSCEWLGLRQVRAWICLHRKQRQLMRHSLDRIGVLWSGWTDWTRRTAAAETRPFCLLIFRKPVPSLLPLGAGYCIMEICGKETYPSKCIGRAPACLCISVRLEGHRQRCRTHSPICS